MLSATTLLDSLLRDSPQPVDGAPRPIRCEVVCSLKVEPELRARAESLREKPGSFGCNATLASYPFVDALHRHADVLCESYLGFVEAGRGIPPEVSHQGDPVHDGWAAWLASVGVDDLHFVGLRILPLKHEAPLLIVPDAVEAGPVSAERLEPVPRRRAQITEIPCRVQRIELPNRPRSRSLGSRNDRRVRTPL